MCPFTGLGIQEEKQVWRERTELGIRRFPLEMQWKHEPEAQEKGRQELEGRVTCLEGCHAAQGHRATQANCRCPFARLPVCAAAQ